MISKLCRITIETINPGSNVKHFIVIGRVEYFHSSGYVAIFMRRFYVDGRPDDPQTLSVPGVFDGKISVFL